MSIDYIVASLPALSFGAPAPISWEKFCELCFERDRNVASPLARDRNVASPLTAGFDDLETQLKNAVAEARVGNADFARPVKGCSLYWRNRVFACFQEKDVAKRDELLDRVWWDAAGELVPPAAPLGRGALACYAVRLKIALKRSKISKEAGNAVFENLTQSSRLMSQDLEAKAK